MSERCGFGEGQPMGWGCGKGEPGYGAGHRTERMGREAVGQHWGKGVLIPGKTVEHWV